jgi:DNA-binding MarR family transcriptional regulator
MEDYMADELRNKLIAILSQMYDTVAFTSLAEFLQGELHVMYNLYINRNTEINPSALSESLHVSRSRITAALSNLREKGYITMEISEIDRRRMCVRLTEEGESFIEGKMYNVQKYFDALISGMGEKNINELIRLIELGTEIMDKEEI